MARKKGIFTQTPNYELQTEGTIDARQFVDFFADLLNFTADNYIAQGFPVTVIEDSTFEGDFYKKGWYQFTGGALNDKANWEYMGGGENFTTQEITSGGNYNDLEVTADLLVFTNENAQAILNGVWGKKEFHILNLSTQYDVRINHNSPSVSGAGVPIKLPTNEGNVGIKGTARILFTDAYGYFVADTWGSNYRPEFKGLTEKKVITVNPESEAETMDMFELIVFRDGQLTPMSKADLNTTYPLAERPFLVICKEIDLIYIKCDNNTNDWFSIPLTIVT